VVHKICAPRAKFGPIGPSLVLRARAAGGQNVRVVLKGIHKVKARLSNGETKTYFYAWRGGPQIKGRPGTPEFIREYHEAHASMRQPRAGTFMTIISRFNAASEFTSLAQSTRRSYLNYIKLIEDEFGDLRAWRSR
jgi:hypothetical protein